MINPQYNASLPPLCIIVQERCYMQLNVAMKAWWQNHCYAIINSAVSSRKRPLRKSPTLQLLYYETHFYALVR